LLQHLDDLHPPVSAIDRQLLMHVSRLCASVRQPFAAANIAMSGEKPFTEVPAMNQRTDGDQSPMPRKLTSTLPCAADIAI
jgi:hypothetical protein